MTAEGLMDSARVQSVDAIKTFRLALVKFADIAARVLSDADAEMQRMLNWLETEQQSHWCDQVQKRARTVEQCRDAVMAKKLYKTVDGGHASAVEEEKALRLAMQRLEEANVRLANVRRYAQRLQKEILLYRGQVQRFTSTITVDVPAAVAHLDNVVTALEAYTASGATETAMSAVVAGSVGTGEALPSMARPEPPVVPETPGHAHAGEVGTAEPACEEEKEATRAGSPCHGEQEKAAARAGNPCGKEQNEVP